MKLSREFYNRSTIKVARELLGKKLVRVLDGRKLSGMIVETEAYIGPRDKASHSYGGRITKRNAVMFGPPGHAYVYQIYGIYFCLNVVTRPRGKPEAILIRALEPIDGVDVMRKFRNGRTLTNGPGRLCQALHIDKTLNDEDLTGDVLYIEDYATPKRIVSTTRVGIDYAEEYKDKRWRFYIYKNRFISRK